MFDLKISFAEKMSANDKTLKEVADQNGLTPQQVVHLANECFVSGSVYFLDQETIGFVGDTWEGVFQRTWETGGDSYQKWTMTDTQVLDVLESATGRRMSREELVDLGIKSDSDPGLCPVMALATPPCSTNFTLLFEKELVHSYLNSIQKES